MIVFGPLWPIEMGSQRVIVEIARYLHSLPGVTLKLVTIAHPQHENEYNKICEEVVFVTPAGRWGFWNVLNKFVSRVGIDAWSVYFTSFAYRSRVQEAIRGSDYIFLNYAIWKGLLPDKMAAERTMVITHDLLFYRRLSFSNSHSLLTRIKVAVNKFFELRLLRKFDTVGVFADYEMELLMKEGFVGSSIIRLGMPISVRRVDGVKKEFDFVFAGGCSYQNEAGIKCFFERVVPLLNRKITFAVVGGISDSPIWETLVLPAHVSVFRLGYVEDLPKTLAKGLIGVGTVPYGSGIKVKVVESIMSGLPMILTNSGEEGIPVLRDAVINIDREEQEVVSKRLNSWLDNKEYVTLLGRKGAEALDNVFRPAKALAGIGNCFMDWHS